MCVDDVIASVLPPPTDWEDEMKMTSVRQISFSREIQIYSQIFGFARPFSARSDEINPK